MASGQDPLLTLLGANQQPRDQTQPPMAVPPQAGGVLPPTSQQPQQSPDMMGLMQRLAEQYQIPAMQKEMQTANQMTPLTQAAPIPQMGYHPNFQPMDSAGHVLGDVGKALLLGLSATGPGRAVQGAIYGPRVREYEAGQKQKAQQIEALKTQAGAYGETGESASRAIGGLGEASYRQGMLGIGEERNKINQQRVDAYRQGVEGRLQTALRGLDLKALMTGSQLALNQARTALTQALPDIMRQRNEVAQYGIDVGSETRQAVANVANQLGMDKTHPFMQMLDEMLGTSMTPAAPQTPGGAQPVRGEKPLPPRKTQPKAAAGANVPAGTVVYDPTGKPHRADGTQPLPKGWSTKGK
jgi:hypothetical protein